MMRRNISGFGLLFAAICTMAGIGCTPNPPGAPHTPAASQGTAEPDVHKQHDHNAPGKHGGQQQLLGNHEYHAELVHNNSTGEVAVYVTDGEFNPVAVPEKTLYLTAVIKGQPKEFTLSAQANPPGGQPRFVLVDKQLCDVISQAQGAVRLNVTIKGKPYAASYAAAHPAEHDHAHSEEDAEEHDAHAEK